MASSQSGTLIVVNSPGTEFALTNCAYTSASDLPRYLARSGQSSGFVLVQDNLVLTILAHDNIQPGTIGLNAVQRRTIKVSANDEVTVVRFTPPERGFSLVLLTVELEFVTNRGKSEQVEEQILSEELLKRFSGQIFTVDQKVIFEYLGINYTFRVVQAVLEGNAEGNATRGLLTSETHFVFETPEYSGIKVQ